MIDTGKIYNEDCLKVMGSIPDGSVDAVVADPPCGFSQIFAEAFRVAKPGAHLLAFGKPQTYHRLACSIEDSGWEIRDCILWVYGDGESAIRPPAEQIVLARKTIDGTIAENVLKHGTGALNIDGCRIPTDAPITIHSPARKTLLESGHKDLGTWQETRGRFPANLIHDGSNDVLALFPDTGTSQGGGMHTKGVGDNRQGNAYGCYSSGEGVDEIGFGDEGSVARFFYCVDSGTDARVELMRYLVRLVCRRGGLVLDPFAGSGETCAACRMEGMDFIGCEPNQQLAEIAERRIMDCSGETGKSNDMESDRPSSDGTVPAYSIEEL